MPNESEIAEIENQEKVHTYTFSDSTWQKITVEELYFLGQMIQ